MCNINLRLLTEQDINDKYISFFADQELTRFSGSVVRSDDKEQLQHSLLEEFKLGISTKRYFIHGIFTTDYNLIGIIKIGSINYDHQISDLYILLGDSAYRGKGLASKALKMAAQIGFTKYKIRKFFTAIYGVNHSALKAYTGAGWIVTGKRKDYYIVDGQKVDRILLELSNPAYN